MTRKFKTEPLSAGELFGSLDALAERVAMVDHRSTGRNVVDRAVRLLLHWWGTGHNPARNVATCRECGGKGCRWIVAPSYSSPGTVGSCPSCRGTGKAVKL